MGYGQFQKKNGTPSTQLSTKQNAVLSGFGSVTSEKCQDMQEWGKNVNLNKVNAAEVKRVPIGQYNEI